MTVCVIDHHLITQTIFQVAAPSSTPPLSSPPEPDCSFYRLSRTAPFCLCLWPPAVSACPQRLCVHLYVCSCLCSRYTQNKCCASPSVAVFWRPYLWLYLPAAFAGLWSWVWGTRDDLWSDSSTFPHTPPFFNSFSSAPHKMQLVHELIPLPAQL